MRNYQLAYREQGSSIWLEGPLSYAKYSDARDGLRLLKELGYQARIKLILNSPCKSPDKRVH